MTPSVTDIREHDGERPLTMLTAYDAPTARLVESACVDMILVGDSYANTHLGRETTLSATVDELVIVTEAVAAATDEVFVVADLPFLAYGVDDAETIKNAGRMIKDAGADAVKIESGPHTVEITRRLTELGIPVMAHLGLTPQRLKEIGGFTRQGTTESAAAEILDLAVAHDDAGAFACVLEHVPANVAAQITAAIDIPTIGIGAGPDCDGQVLVVDDAVGLSDRLPPFAKAFADVRGELERGITGFVDAVENGEFPGEEHSHVQDELDELY